MGKLCNRCGVRCALRAEPTAAVMARGEWGMPPLIMAEVRAETGCRLYVDGASVRELRMRRAGAVHVVRVRLRCMLRWRDTSGGESAHYMCQWADEEGAWWEADGMRCAGEARPIPTPLGGVTARTGLFFPVVVIYERAGEGGATVN